MTSVSAGHIVLTSTQRVGSGSSRRESNIWPPDQESRALPSELPRPHTILIKSLLHLDYLVLVESESESVRKRAHEDLN